MPKKTWVSKELIVQSKKNGIRLIKPNEAQMGASTPINVANLLDEPYNVWFTDLDISVQIMNDSGLATCGFNSPHDSFGKVANDFLEKATAEFCVATDIRVMKSEKMHINEYELFRRDGTVIQALAIRLPWYIESKLIGVLGCSINIGTHSILQSLDQWKKFGLLSTNLLMQYHPLLQINDNDFPYLSKRESECLSLLVKGKTAKQTATLLNLSTRTVQHYIENIKNKMNAYSKSDLIEKAISYFSANK